MLSYEQVKERARKRRQQNVQQVTGQDKGKTLSFEEVKERARGRLAQNTQQNADAVKKWFSDVYALGGRVQEYYSGDGYKTPEISFNAEIDKYIGQAGKMLSYIKSNEQAYDDYDGLIQMHTDTVTGLQNLKRNVEAANNYFAHFESEEDYKEAAYYQEYGNLSYEEIKDKIFIMPDGEKREWLSKYAPTVMTAEDYDKEISSVEGEIINLEAVLEEYKIQKQKYSEPTSEDYAYVRMMEIHNQYGGQKDIKALITQKKAERKKLELARDSVKLSSVADPESENYDPDFALYAQKGAAVENPDMVSAAGAYVFGLRFGDEEVRNKVAYTRDNYDEFAKKGFGDGLDAEVMQDAWKINDLYLKMTEDEMAIYNYHLAKDIENGTNNADIYLQGIEETLQKRKAGDLFDPIKGKVLAELLFGIEAGLYQFGSGVKNFFNTKDDYIPQNAVQIASSMVSEDLADNSFNVWYNFKTGEWEDTIGGKSMGQIGYSAINTTANMAPTILASAVANYIAPGSGVYVGSALQGVSSAGNAYQEALNLGYDKSQARSYSTLVGASEATLQYLLGGIGSLGGVADDVLLAKVATIDSSLLRVSAKMGIKIGSEIVEEELQLFLEPLFRSIIFSEDYDAPTIDEMIETAIVTALSTGLLEGPGTIGSEVSQTIEQRRTGRTIMAADGGVDALKNLANEVAGVSTGETLEGLRKQIATVDKKATSRKIGKLYETVNSANNLANASANKADIAKSLQRKGFNAETANNIAEALVASYNGQSLTKTQEKLLKTWKNSKYVQEAISNIMVNEKSTMGQRGQNLRDFFNSYIVEEDFSSETGTGTDVASSFSMGESEYKDSDNELQEIEGKATLNDNETVLQSTGEVVSFEKFTKVENGKATVLANGKEVDAADISLGDEGTDLVFHSVIGFDNMTASGANTIMQAYKKGGVSAGAFGQGAAVAYRWGYHGFSETELAKQKYASKLTEVQRDVIYQAGREAGIAATEADQNRVDNIYAEAQEILEQKGVEKTHKHRAVLEDGITLDSLSESQRVSFDLADKVAQAAKVGVRVYIGEPGEFGYYDHNSDTVCLNLNAKNKSRVSMMAFTLGHELVHRAKQGSPKKYKAFADFLVQEYGKQGVSMEELIAEQIAAAKQHNIELSYDKAFEEVVCDACQRMLLDTNAGQRLAEFGARSEQNKGILKELKRWISQFMDRLRKVFKGVDPDSMAAKEFAKFDKTVQQTLADMFVDMTIDAGEKLSMIQNAFGKSIGEGQSYALTKTNPYEGKSLYKDAEAYNYDFMTSQDPMTIAIMPNLTAVKTGNNVNQSKAIALGLVNASTIGREVAKGQYAIKNNYTQKEIIVGSNGLGHSLDASNKYRLRTNARLSAIGGEIVKNAIPINGLEKKNKQANGTYAMACLVFDGGSYVVAIVTVDEFTSKVMEMEYVDITHSINGRRLKETGDSRPATGASELGQLSTSVSAISEISISDFLEIVNSTHRSILSNDVLQHFNNARPKDGYYAEKVLFKLSTGEDTSPRALLANALESVAQNESENYWIKQYREKISQLNEQEQKLHEQRAQVRELSFAKGKRDTAKIKELQLEAVKTENRINILDKQLLRIEAAKPLRELLESEKAKAKKRAEQKAKRDLEAYRKAERERSEKREKEIREGYQESRKKATESRHRTEMRHKIQKVVKKLNDLLLKETKDKHVPENLKNAVAEALDAVNMDTVGAEDRLAKYDALIAEATDPDVIASLEETRERIANAGDRLSERMAKLKAAYDSIKSGAETESASIYDEVIAEKIQETLELVGDTALRDMNMQQLEAVYEMYTMVSKSISNANKAFKLARAEGIRELGAAVGNEITAAGGSHPYSVKALEGVKRFDWNNQKPVYAFERMGSKTLSELYENVRAGEDTWARDVTEAKAFYQEQAEKYGYDQWDMKKQYTFASTTGNQFTLSLEQIMSLYAYAKREQAGEHLSKGGFVFDSAIEVVQKKHGIPVKYKVNTASAYNLSGEILADIIGTLTEEQAGFVDAMQEYLSAVMGEKGNEVSMALYDVKLFKEKNYFPLWTAKQYIQQKSEAVGELRLKNSGFSKKTVPHANNPVILGNFTDVWAGHVNDMSMYHAFVLPLEDFNRVYNYSESAGLENADTESVKARIQNAYGKQANDYIEQLLKDLNGGARQDPRETATKKLVSNFKKAAVMGSLSVIVQQPTALIRAMAIVDGRYFGIMPITRGLIRTVNAKKHRQLWSEVKQYAPVAVIKEMGHFDTSMGRSTQEFIKAKEYKGLETVKGFLTDSGYRDEVISRPAALADEMAWVAIWEAVKNETADKHKDLPVGSEAFLKVVGKRFTEVVVKTQVYDSVLSRSANMRAKSGLMDMLTSFMAEPTTSINMLQDALLKVKRGDLKGAAKEIGAVYGSMILNAALVSFVYAMRDDDEDETFWEKYLSQMTVEVLDGFNPLTYIPIVKDIWSIMQGFDVERADMSLIADLVDAMQKAAAVISKDTSDMEENELEEHRKQISESLWEIGESIASLTGLPVKNIRRDINGVINFFQTLSADNKGRKTTANSLVDAIQAEGQAATPVVGWLPGESKKDKLYDAIINGDADYVERIRKTYASEKSYETAVRSIARTKFADGELSADDALEMLTEHGGFDGVEAAEKVAYWNFQDTYAEYSDWSQSAVTKYYDYAKPAGISLEAYDLYRKKSEGLNRKEDLLEVIDSLPLTDKQKDALYYMNGWAESKLSEAPWH